MSISHKRLVATAAIVIIAILAQAGGSPAQTIRLEVEVSGELTPVGATVDTLSVMIRNPIDSVAGFVIWLQLNRPDVIRFIPGTLPQYVVDSSAPSLVNGWDVLSATSLSGQGTDIKIVGLADFPGGQVVPPFLPSDSYRQLIKIPFTVLPGADTMADRTVIVNIQTGLADLFNFSTPNGTTITWADTIGGVPVLDTNKIKARHGAVQVGQQTCIADGDLNTDGMVLTVADFVYGGRVIAGMVDAPDSLYHYDFNADCVMDSADARIYGDYFIYGMPAFLPWPYPHPTCCNVALRLCCQGMAGNVDCDPEDKVDISDITALVDNLYMTMTSPCCWGEANVDGDAGRSVDISDLSALIDYLYISYTPPAQCF